MELCIQYSNEIRPKERVVQLLLDSLYIGNDTIPYDPLPTHIRNRIVSVSLSSIASSIHLSIHPAEIASIRQQHLRLLYVRTPSQLLHHYSARVPRKFPTAEPAPARAEEDRKPIQGNPLAVSYRRKRRQRRLQRSPWKCSSSLRVSALLTS